MITRRRFLAGILPLAAVTCGGLTYWGYRRGACPLSSQEICEGPCAAYLAGGDGLCLRLPRVAAVAEAPVAEAPVAEAAAPEAAAPTPTASPTRAAPAATPSVAPSAVAPAPTATPQPALATRCPFGLRNDPYPGRCRRYVDRNGNGYCDLSEPDAAP